jgi:arginine N-succinyltransferase
MPRFIYRLAELDDLDAIHALALHLDSLNLPADRVELAGMITRSIASTRHDTPAGEFLFVLESIHDRRVVGTSMILAAHGTPDDPHHSLRVDREERYSETLGRLFVHQTLTLVQSYTPHTEIGALVLDPAFRGHPDRLGRILSFGRFLYIAMFRQRFCSEVQAELLPCLLDDGSSPLWEWLGRPFTGLGYQEADRLSRRNREFVRSLFPRGPIHVALAPETVRETIGVVGPTARPVAYMLEQAGFRFNRHLDPFDGGPHLAAATDHIDAIRRVVTATVGRLGGEGSTTVSRGLLAAVDRPFVAVATPYAHDEGTLFVPDETLTCLGLASGDRVTVVPLDPRGAPP